MLLLYGVLIAVGAVALAALITVMIQRPKVWVSSVIIIFAYFLADSGIGISVTEVIAGAFILLSIVLWIAVQLASGRKLIRGWPDLFIFAFIGLSTLNSIVAVANDVPIEHWIFEWSLFLMILYYFPIREYFSDSEESLRQLLVVCAVSAILMAIYTAYDYYSRSNSAFVFAYQIMASRSRLFAPAFYLALVILLPMIFHVRKFRTKLILIALIIINVAGLIQSFTRTLWVVFILSYVLIMIFLNWKQRFRLLAGTATFFLVAYGVAMTLYPRITELALTIITKRFTSSTQLKGGDYSFEARLIELDAIESDLTNYFISGVGIRHEYVAWDPIVLYHIKKSFIHIGYANLLYKLGLGLTVLLMVVLFLFTIRTFNISRSAAHNTHINPITRATVIGLLAFQPALYSFILVAGFFDQRFGNALLAVTFGFCGIVYSRIQYCQNKQITTQPV